MEQLQMFKEEFTKEDLLKALVRLRTPSERFNFLETKMAQNYALWHVLNFEYFNDEYEDIMRHTFLDVKINDTSIKFWIDFDDDTLYCNDVAIHDNLFYDENDIFDDKFFAKIKSIIKKYVLKYGHQFFI